MRFEVGLSIRLQHQFAERLCVEKPLVRFACIDAIAGMFGIDRDGELFPDLGAHFEVFRDLGQIASELVRCGWSERWSRSHRAKKWFALIEILAILPETVSRKGRLSILALVDLPLPAFIGPGRGAEPDQIRERHAIQCTGLRRAPQESRQLCEPSVNSDEESGSSRVTVSVIVPKCASTTPVTTHA